MKIYKYMVEGELCNLEKIDKSYFTDYINKLSIKQNALVREEKKGIYWYYCTNCKKWHKDIKFNVKIHKKCPYCKHKYKVVTKRNIIPKYEDYITVLEKNERNELIIRLFYFKRIYDKHFMDFQITCIEVERINVDRDVYMQMNTYSNMGYITHELNGRIKRDNNYSGYYGNYKKRGEIYPYDNVITKNIKRLLKNTQYRYSCLDIVARNHLDIHDYLVAYKKCNKLELLVKNKNFKLIKDIIHNQCIPEELEDNKNLKYLKHNLDLSEFVNACYFHLENYNDIKLYASLNAKNYYYIIERYNKNLNKVCHYLDDQKEGFHFYRDYLSFAYELGCDLDNKNVLYPYNLKIAHDELEEKFEVKRDKEISLKINKRSKELEKFNFHKNHLSIFPAHSQNDLIRESRELKHCVRIYAERVANGETNIFFIRKDNQLEKPYVTLELNDNRVIQVRGYMNSANMPLDKNVKKFVNLWCMKFNFKSCFD